MEERYMAERLLRRDRVVLATLIFVLFALAAIYTVTGVGMSMSAVEMTAMRDMRDMPGAIAPGQWPPGYALLVFLMWWIMMIAMMLPSVTPTVLLYTALLRRGSDLERAAFMSSCFLAGYLLAWAGFSVAAALAQWALEAGGYVSAAMMTFIDSTPFALVLIATGVFQFTPLKQSCLSHCRSPVHFLTWRRRSGPVGAMVMGCEHGAYCLGCCWFLMALLFAGGVMNLYWIVGLAAFVAVEKLTPYGVVTSKLAGAALIAWGTSVLVISA